jgi:hypothetical protein
LGPAKSHLWQGLNLCLVVCGGGFDWGFVYSLHMAGFELSSLLFVLVCSIGIPGHGLPINSLHTAGFELSTPVKIDKNEVDR